MEWDFKFLELARSFDNIMARPNLEAIVDEWETESSDYTAAFYIPRPMGRTALLKEILNYIDDGMDFRLSLKSVIPALLIVFDNVSFKEDISHIKYQSAIRIIHMLSVLSTSCIDLFVIKPFYYKCKSILVDSSTFMDLQDREKRKTLPHVTFPNEPFSETKSPYLPDHRYSLQTPQARARKPNLVIHPPSSPDSNTLKSPYTSPTFPQSAPFSPLREFSRSISATSGPRSPLVVFKGNRSHTPLKAVRSSWSKV